MRVKAGTGKVKDVEITDVTPENYIVPQGEEHLYHAMIEVKKFDANTGKRMSVPRVQKFGQKGFESGILSDLKKQGYTVDILHDPNDYIAEQAEAKQAQATANAEAKAKAAEEAKAAAAKAEEERINAAVAKALEAQATANAKATQEAIDKAVADAVAKVTAKK